jgi:hypothetical protein
VKKFPWVQHDEKSYAPRVANPSNSEPKDDRGWRIRLPPVAVCDPGLYFEIFHIGITRNANTQPRVCASPGVNLLMPKDWQTIYDVTPLFSEGLDGTGAK